MTDKKKMTEKDYEIAIEWAKKELEKKPKEKITDDVDNGKDITFEDLGLSHELQLVSFVWLLGNIWNGIWEAIARPGGSYS